MELDLVVAGAAEDGMVEADNTGDTADLETERCGICTDVVIDRGLLDCCQHWFCFACIDNWATITNLCPLCQNEFQLITCVPVFDTIGSNKFEEESREDDWCVDGSNNTLSFPSYYIDENAVFCLEGNDCKVRAGSTNAEGDSDLDTSIACDSCDIWYHAFCVGFDPEGSSEDTWLCPRCIDHQMQKNLNASSTPESHLSHQELGSSGCSVENSLSGKVSVSLADAGETALVVSMVVADDHSTKEPYESEQTITEVMECKTTSSTYETPSAKSGEICPKLEPQELEVSLTQDSSFNFHAVNTLASGSLNGDNLIEGCDMNNADRTKARAREEVGQQTPSDNIVAKDEHTIYDAGDDAVKAIGGKRKRAQSSGSNGTDADSEGTKANSDSGGLKKRSKTKFKVDVGLLEDQASDLVPDDRKSSPTPISDNEDPSSLDIMSIVRGAKRSSSKGLKASIGGESGLRVKKIMRRAVEDKDQAVVQKLREEIREAARDKLSKELGERIVDPKLLAAFRAAVTGTDNEPVKKLPTAAIKAKKFMLQKGKVRENLTKKIYASSSGKRKRAWDRECEVEFWKYRCKTGMRPEKIDTLKSVLGLLKKSTEIRSDMVQGSEEHSKDSILSRLYVADTSIFPRKDDIKPLSNSEVASTSQQKPIETNKNVLSSNSGASSVRATSSKLPVRPPTGVSKGNTNKETEDATDIKSDKKKWALAVLARKTASVSKSGTSEHGDNAIFKGNYPLLAQLPADMRPVLAPSRHNKIPQSVRQAQLYRLTEHFLKKANVSSNCRTAEAELAVADAVNVEKSVADRSNIKLVYINLCSQEILHRTGNSQSANESESNPSPPRETTTEKSDEEINEQLVPEVEETGEQLTSEAEAALRAAGLLSDSDSPPGSPLRAEGSENILELDCNPDLDIYGDFEYDLGDEDYVGAAAMKSSVQQPDAGGSKMKVVFSTFGSERCNDVQDPQDDHSSLINKLCESETPDKVIGIEVPSSDGGVSGKPGASDKVLPGEGDGEEPSAAEYEELYGPDKEPLFINCPAVLVENYGRNEKETQNGNESTGECESSDSSHVVKKGGPVSVDQKSSTGKHYRRTSQSKNKQGEAKKADSNAMKQSGGPDAIMKKVEAYIKEHIRPLCKSGVISPEQYRWAVTKTTEKVMRFHSKAKNANFLIKEGEKVKRLAEQYVEAAQKKDQE